MTGAISKRQSYKDVIRENGIPEDLFMFYREAFASRQIPYIFRKGDDAHWVYKKQWRLSPSALARHLSEEIYVGTFASWEMDYFLMDIDNKGSEAEFRGKVERVREIFPSGVGIQSSPSRGLHYYVFLKDRYHIADLLNYARTRLFRHGMEVKNGYVELFPQLRKGVRCPFSKASHVMNLDKYAYRTETKVEDISFIQNQVSRLHVEDIFEDEDIAGVMPTMNANHKSDRPSIRLNKNTNKTNNTHSSVSIITDYDLSLYEQPTHLECIWYLENGLMDFGTRYEVTTMLIIFLTKVLRLSPEATFDLLEAWHYERTNGKSKDWANNPNWVLTDLEERIRSINEWASSWYGLSDAELLRVLQLNFDFRPSWFLFDLMKFLKTKADMNGIVYISQHLLYRMNGCSHRNYQERLALAVSCGFIWKIGNYVYRSDGTLGIPTKYRTSLTFDKGNQQYADFPTAAAQILGQDEFIRRWSRHYWTEYVAEGAD